MCLVLVLMSAPGACAQEPNQPGPATSRLSLGVAVDTTVAPAGWWGVDAALAARSGVVRMWDDYLAVRGDSARRVAFWSASDRTRMRDPDLAVAGADYITSVDAVLIEAIPLVAGDSSQWVLRTVYTSGGNVKRPNLLAIERMHVVRDGSRWALSHPGVAETANWHRQRIGQIEYIVHPSISFDAARAAATAKWVDDVARRFAVTDTAPITYFQLPDLQAAGRVMGLEWMPITDRVGGRALVRSRTVLAADPRFAEGYVHELAHVVLAPWMDGAPSFVQEGIAYWLGGARGQPFPLMMRDFASHLKTRPGLTLHSILSGGEGAGASSRFPAAAAMFELAYRRGGDPAVRRMADTVRAGEVTVEALASVVGLTAPEVEAEWRATIASFSK